jgi:carboxyl-terminal processing protease
MSSSTAHDKVNKKRRERMIHPVVFSFSLAVTLVVGVMLGTYRHQIYASIAPIFGIKASAETLDTTLLQQTYRALVANFDGTLDKSALERGATRGMVQAAGDEYTAFFSPEEASEFDNDMSGSIGGGIGAQVGMRGNKVTLVKIIADTPAERSGLKAGDAVLKINDESTEGFTTEKAVEKIRGEIGTTVKLGIERQDQQLDIVVTREAISAPSVSHEIKDGIGIMTMSRFDQDTNRLARQAAEVFASEKVKGVILDLRGNPGGYLTAARDVAGIWLNKKVVVIEKEGGRVVEELKSGSSPLLEGVPTVVLVDGGSASASEIVAGALQDHRAATLLGETTYGKGSVQRLLPLADGSMLKVTVARWYTPNGKNITKEGIRPDVEVEITEQQLRDGDDVQMRAALERL